MKIRFEELNHHSCKCYLFGPANSDQVAIVDPNLEFIEKYRAKLQEEHLTLRYIIDTHTHADHISAAAVLFNEFGGELIMGEKAPAECVTTRVSDDMIIDFDGILMKFITTPGHTKDALSIILPEKILTGDALFLEDGGAGRDDLPGGSPEEHWQSLVKLKGLDEQLVVYPSHDYRERIPNTLKVQKETNPYLQFTTESDFLQYLQDLELGPADWMADVLKANYNCTTNPKAAWIPIDGPTCESLGTLKTGAEDEEVEWITIEMLKVRLEKGAQFKILDVRHPTELKGKMGTFPNAQNVALTSLVKDISQLKDWKTQEIVVLCGSGKRSQIAAQVMQKAGYQDVKVLEGGLKAWRQKYGS